MAWPENENYAFDTGSDAWAHLKNFGNQPMGDWFKRWFQNPTMAAQAEAAKAPMTGGGPGSEGTAEPSSDYMAYIAQKQAQQQAAVPQQAAAPSSPPRSPDEFSFELAPSHTPSGAPPLQPRAASPVPGTIPTATPPPPQSVRGGQPLSDMLRPPQAQARPTQQGPSGPPRPMGIAKDAPPMGIAKDLKGPSSGGSDVLRSRTGGSGAGPIANDMGSLIRMLLQAYQEHGMKRAAAEEQRRNMR